MDIASCRNIQAARAAFIIQTAISVIDGYEPDTRKRKYLFRIIASCSVVVATTLPFRICCIDFSICRILLSRQNGSSESAGSFFIGCSVITPHLYCIVVLVRQKITVSGSEKTERLFFLFTLEVSYHFRQMPSIILICGFISLAFSPTHPSAAALFRHLVPVTCLYNKHTLHHQYNSQIEADLKCRWFP